MDGHRLREPMEAYAFLLGQVVFELKGGHLRFAAAIEHVHLLRAQPQGRGSCVDGRVAAADHHHAPAHRRASVHLIIRDEPQGVDHARQPFAGYAEGLRAAQAHAQEDDIELLFHLFDAQLAADLRAQRNSTPNARTSSTSCRLSEGRSLYSATP
jgi:hypothetical protein